MFEKEIGLSFECEVDTNVNRLYDFHIDTNNLPLITPPWIQTQILSLELPLHEGSEIGLAIKRLNLRQEWKMKIEKMQRPSLVCDKALKSPFASFIHYHRFEAINETKSKMRDEVHFSLPLYPLSLFVLPFIKRDMEKMFAYRHQETKKLLEKKHV